MWCQEALLVRLLSSRETITTLAGTGVPVFAGNGGNAAAAALHTPVAVATDANGHVYIGTSGDHRVRQVPAGAAPRVIDAWAGAGGAGAGGDDGDPATAQFSGPCGIFADEAGRNLFVADAGNHRVRRAVL